MTEDSSPTSSPDLSPRVVAAAAGGPVSARRAELRRVAVATRELIEGLVGTDVSATDLASAADGLEALAARFAHEVPRSMYDGIAEAAMAGVEPDDPASFFDHSPMIGKANPLAPPITIEVDGDTIVGHVTFGAAYEGPPGCVHGGYVAASFDEVLGAAQTFSGAPGMTARLTVNYRKPTPLHAPLRFEGRFLRLEGRKVFTEGRVLADGVVTAEAEALFVSIGVEKFRALREQRDARLGKGT